MAQRRDLRTEIPSPLLILAIVAICLFGSHVSGGDRSEAMNLGVKDRPSSVAFSEPPVEVIGLVD